MKQLFHVLCALLLCNSCLAAEPAASKDEIKKEGDWSYVRVVWLEGTRSEVVLGKIKYKNGEVVGQPNHVLDLPFGRFVWKAAYDKGFTRGWQPLDADAKGLIPVQISAKTLGGLYHTTAKE